MDKNQILLELKKTFLFRSLSEKSKNELLGKWETFSDEQLQKILFLTMAEKIMASAISQIGRDLMKETRKKAMKQMVKKLEKTTASNDEKLLNDLMKNYGI